MLRFSHIRVRALAESSSRPPLQLVLDELIGERALHWRVRDLVQVERDPSLTDQVCDGTVAGWEQRSWAGGIAVGPDIARRVAGAVRDIDSGVFEGAVAPKPWVPTVSLELIDYDEWYLQTMEESIASRACLAFGAELIPDDDARARTGR